MIKKDGIIAAIKQFTQQKAIAEFEEKVEQRGAKTEKIQQFQMDAPSDGREQCHHQIKNQQALYQCVEKNTEVEAPFVVQLAFTEKLRPNTRNKQRLQRGPEVAAIVGHIEGQHQQCQTKDESGNVGVGRNRQHSVRSFSGNIF